MQTISAHPILLSGIDHLPCLQEIRSVKDKPFYCQSSVGTRFCYPELTIFHAPLHLSRELGQGFMGGGGISRLLAPNVPADEAVVESLVRVAFKTVRITGPSSALDTAAITEILQRDYSNMIRRSSAGTRKSNPKSRIKKIKGGG